MSMGCAKNSVDSEHLIGLLESSGHRIVESADSNVVNMLKVVVRNAHHNPNSALRH